MSAPVFYIPHGGGPMPLLGDANHASLIKFLKALPQQFAKPKAIVLISAHWEEAQATVYAGAAHPMLLPAQPHVAPDPNHIEADSAVALRAAVAYVGGMTDRYACRQAVTLLDWDPRRLPTGIDIL